MDTLVMSDPPALRAMHQGCKRLSCCIALLVLAADVCAATIYKCRNAEGSLIYQEAPCENAVQAIASWASVSTLADHRSDDAEAAASDELTISQGNGGHYFVDGAVNDRYLSFVIDTGATVVALPDAAAARAGVRCEGGALMETANGVTQACTTTIDKLRFGNFTLHHVSAMVVPHLSQPLLGMNVLKRFRVEQDNGQMRLARRY